MTDVEQMEPRGGASESVGTKTHRRRRRRRRFRSEPSNAKRGNIGARFVPVNFSGMDPTARFFAALKNTAATLESESEKLRHAFDNRDNSDEDGGAEARALRAYHQVTGDVRALKGQIQGQVVEQRAQDKELDGFIRAARAMEPRLAMDIQTLRGHWEKYGYRAPPEARRPTESEDEAAAQMDTESTNEAVNQEEDGGSRSPSPRAPAGPPPLADPLRTPQLSDFGLCEVEMKRALAVSECCSAAPPMPELSLPHPALGTPPPPMPVTPKRALRMDEDELQTPQMSDFGLSEHTMCLNNDFTMDLFQKNLEKLRRPHLEMPVPPVSTLMGGLHSHAQNLVSPEPPAFLTPGFKLRKADAPPPCGDGDPQCPGRHGNLPASPAVPVFETPYMKRMATCSKSARQPEADMRAGEGLPPPGSKRRCEYAVPDGPVAEDNPMPDLESALGNSLQTRGTKMQKKTLERTESTEEPPGAAQEFSLATPRLRADYQEPSTPEMPDLSSVTQDICKLLTQAQLKKPCTAVVKPTVRPKKDPVRLSEVSEREFQTLPKYLKQMSLHNLNQAVHHINKFTEDCPGEQTEFRVEDLKRICFTETKTPVYILCLTELKRLEHTGGARSNSVYKLCSLR
ncbi:SKA complex subunit 3 isoform 2-T2 [Spinachia spinachia]